MNRPAALSSAVPSAERSTPAARPGQRRSRWCASAALGAIAVLGSGTVTPTAPGPLTPGTVGPVDRTVVAVPPVYPSPPSGFLRLPDTQSAPVQPIPAPGPQPLGPRVQQDPRLSGAGPGVATIEEGRPVWTPARLEPAVGIDGRGRVTSILEYTPGRFER